MSSKHYDTTLPCSGQFRVQDQSYKESLNQNSLMHRTGKSIFFHVFTTHWSYHHKSYNFPQANGLSLCEIRAIGQFECLEKHKWKRGPTRNILVFSDTLYTFTYSQRHHVSTDFNVRTLELYIILMGFVRLSL